MVADVIELRVGVTPRAGADAIETPVPDACGERWLALKVRAVPANRRANPAVLALLAERLNLPASALTSVAGARWKRVYIAGGPERIAAVARLAQPPETAPTA